LGMNKNPDMEYLARLKPETLTSLIEAIEMRILALAMKGASDDVCHAVFSAFPPTDLTRFGEALDMIGPVTIVEVEDAQRQVLKVAREV
jgi:flagellar motor switch protein FliG